VISLRGHYFRTGGLVYDTGLLVDISFFFPNLTRLALGVNLLETICLNKFLFLLTKSVSHLLWNTVDTNNFYFILFNFSDFILILFCFLFDFLLDNEEVCDTAVT